MKPSPRIGSVACIWKGCAAEKPQREALGLMGKAKEAM